MMHIITSTAREYNVPTLDFDYVHVEQVDMVQSAFLAEERKGLLRSFVTGFEKGERKTSCMGSTWNPCKYYS